MQEKKKYNKIEYNAEYNRTHYKTFKANLKPDDYEEIEEILKKENWSKADYLRESIKWYNKDKNK